MLKKILAIACTIFMLGSISAFALEPTPVPTPVVRNGDFESAYSSSEWAGLNVTLKEANFVTTHKHSGEKSLRLPGADNQLTYAKQTVTFDFVAGTTYVLSLWYYNPAEGTATSVKGNVVVYAAGTNLVSTALFADTASTAWVLKYFEFTPATNLSSIEIWLCNYSQKADASIYYDDVTLIERKPILVANGDMESAAWDATELGTNGTVERVGGAASGDYCMKINGNGTGSNPVIYKMIEGLKTNTEYELSFYFKTDSQNGYPRVGIGNHWFYSESGATACLDGITNADKNKPGVTNTWVKCTYYFKTDETIPISSGKTTPFITLYGLKSIPCYYDKVELVEATNKIMLHDMAGKYGADVTSIKNGLAANTKFYAKGRFIPTATSTSAVLIVAVFDESTGTKQLQDVQVAPYTGTDGAAQTLETAITVENPATSSVEVYMWDSLSGMSRYLKKLRVAATE